MPDSDAAWYEQDPDVGMLSDEATMARTTGAPSADRPSRGGSNDSMVSA